MVGWVDVDGVAPGEQSYVERQPAPALSGLVRSVWVQRIASESVPYLQRNIPTGGIELLYPVGSDLLVVGPLTRPLVDLLAAGTTVVGLRFGPGAASALLGLPASELVDLTVKLDELWGCSAVMLGERMFSTGTPDLALAVLQRYVAGRLAMSDGLDSVILEAVRQLMPWRSTDVGAVASALSLSESQLRRRCVAAVGLAPKTLHRTLRFQGFLALAQRRITQGGGPTDARLAELAAEAGYADQAHLSRECLRLTGASPRAFLGDAEQKCACGHDHAASYAPLLRALPQST